MKSPRETCEFRDRCGKSGHYLGEDGRWHRCRCLQLEISARTLGQFYCSNPRDKTQLSLMMEKGENLLLEGPLVAIKPHMARVLLDLLERGTSFTVLDAYRFIEIFLEKDEEFDTTTESIMADLMVILLGFADPRNKYLPELLTQAIQRRLLLGKLTWVVLGIDRNLISTKYSVDLQDILAKFQRVTVK